MRQALRICRQCLEGMPEGDHMAKVPRVLRPPAGEAYAAVESPRGELGVYLEGDGGPKPRRVSWRTPSFDNLSVISTITKGHLVADLIAILASVDIVLGDIDR
jgi:NADH-quinone oxidoreductase subunit D